MLVYYYFLIFIIFSICIFICYSFKTNDIHKLRYIFPPSISNDQSFFFVRTRYRNISFNQCIRSNDCVSDYIKRTGMWKECQEIFDIWNLRSKHDAFIDLGANIGSCSFLFAEIGVKVYSFEPLPNNLFLFSLTAFSSFKFKKYISIYPYALGKEEKEQVIHILKNNWGASSLYRNHTDYSETIHVKTLDKFEQILPHKVSMIKIDVEGGEYDLLEGGYNFFKTHETEFMYIEANCGEKENDGFYEVEKLYRILNRIGYDVEKRIDCNKVKSANIIAKLKIGNK